MPRKVTMPGGDTPDSNQKPVVAVVETPVDQPGLFDNQILPEETEEVEFEDSDAQDDDLYVDDEPSIQVEDIPADTVLWEGGPTAGQVVAWKEQFSNVYLTSITPDDHIIWRPIDRKEYRQLIRHMEKLRDEGRMGLAELNLAQEEIITTLGSLFPSYKNFNFDTELAGLPSILSQQILESSGFQAVDVREL